MALRNLVASSSLDYELPEIHSTCTFVRVPGGQVDLGVHHHAHVLRCASELDPCQMIKISGSVMKPPS